MNAEWTILIDQLPVNLAVGIYPHELPPQPMLVSLGFTGDAIAMPQRIGQCLDYEPLCNWLLDEWQNSSHVPLLETRINQLLEYIFSNDIRVTSAWAGLYKKNVAHGAIRIGMERRATRRQFEESASWKQTE